MKQPEIVSAEDFIESLRGRDIKVILQGELLKEFVDHPIDPRSLKELRNPLEIH